MVAENVVQRREVRTRRLVSFSREYWVAEIRGYGKTEQEALSDCAAQAWKVQENGPHQHDQGTEEFDWAYLR